jgi:hypothetical protein
MARIETIKYTDWRQFKADSVYDLFGESRFRRDRYLFRGQMSADWKLESSFDRWFMGLSGSLDRIQTAEKLLKLFKSGCEGLKIAKAVSQDDINALATGQHFGLPTRLLDWSESPYIAAFFAFSDAISVGITDGHVAIWALNLHSKIWNRELGVEIVSVPASGNQRLWNQEGRFSLSRTPFSCLEDYVTSSDTDDMALRKMILPVSEARQALSDLDSMGINHFRVYPEVVGCALAAKMQALLDS